MWTPQEELNFREKLFSFIIELANDGDGTLTRAELSSVKYAGKTIRVIDDQGGIWNPTAAWPFPDQPRATLTLNTTLKSNYQDREVDGGLWRYDYQAGSMAGKNTKMRVAIEHKFPLLWFKQIENGGYIPYRVFIVADFPEDQYCLMAPEEAFWDASKSESELERRYVKREMKVRLHQPAFRARVISAYETRCAICQLRHGRLLDAAHITPDNDESTSTSVTNGLALCKIHHAAYDINIIGINSDYVVKVREDVLREVDGPMLQHGLVEMDGQVLWVPGQKDDQPNRERLATRFRKFVDAQPL